MSVRMTRLLSVALIGACLTTTAFARSHPHHSRAHAPARGAGSLIWRGDDATANGVVDEVAKAWERSGHGHIVMQPFNTASGLDAVSSGAADLAGSARPADGSAQNANLTFTPVAWDALVIVTQASNPVRGLSLKQVHDIYYGKIHNWSEVGGRNAPIDVYAVASPGDGVEYSLRSLLFGRGNQPVAAPRLYVNTRKLQDGIALNPNGMGVSTLTSIRGNPRLKAVPIDGKSATVANVADGSYPLFTTLYLVTNPHSRKAAQAQAFVDFMRTGAGEAALRRHAVLPYQDGRGLVAMDDSRRDGILAEVGARPRHHTPISAPGATYAARVAIAPTSPDTVAARRELEHRRAAAADNARLSRVSGSAAYAHDSATTAMRTHGEAFGKVRANTHHTGTTYKVVKGDTLGSIAKRHDVRVTQLRQWNHLKNNQIRLGQTLLVSDR